MRHQRWQRVNDEAVIAVVCCTDKCARGGIESFTVPGSAMVEEADNLKPLASALAWCIAAAAGVWTAPEVPRLSYVLSRGVVSLDEIDLLRDRSEAVWFP